MIAQKGFCTGAKTVSDVEKLKSLNTQWWYSWGSLPKLGASVPGFVPMVWGRKSLGRGNSIREIRDGLASTKADAVLGFNEPDHDDQADMTPEAAVGLWDQVEALALDGLRIGSPAQVTPNRDWIDRFLKLCNESGKRVDIVAVHHYQKPDAKLFIDKIDALYDRVARPIWITEMGVADWDATTTRPNQYTRTQVNDFMAEVVPLIRARPFVEKFAWKTRTATDPVMGCGALFHTNGRLTTTGKLSASL